MTYECPCGCHIEIADLRRQLEQSQTARQQLADALKDTLEREREAQQARAHYENSLTIRERVADQYRAERDAANALLRRAEPYCKTTSGHPYDEGLCAAITAHLEPKRVEDAEGQG